MKSPQSLFLLPFSFLPFLVACATGLTEAPTANRIDASQQAYTERYAGHKGIVPPELAQFNFDAEPDLSAPGFVDLYNGRDLEGWRVLGGNCTFEAVGEKIVGTVVVGSPSTYLTTVRDDYADFILTAELFWEVNSNSGVQFRSRERTAGGEKTVYGPQVEMEGFTPRGWSGGIFGQGLSTWLYPLWLEGHREARTALREGEWNRVTVLARGPDIKTWVNGVPTAHWRTEEFLEGFISLQIHSGKEGEVHFRKVRVKELAPSGSAWVDLFQAGDFSDWTRVKGEPVSSAWTFEDGVVHRGGVRPGDIITREDYQDFELRFQWKVSEGGNSGIKYRTRGSLGLEYQILDDRGHRDGANPRNRAAGLYNLYEPNKDKRLEPVGEWNHGRILAEGNRIEHWINGHRVVAAEIGSADWNERFAASKYKEHDGFGTWAGPILLQDHGDAVWFRQVQIRPR